MVPCRQAIDQSRSIPVLPACVGYGSDGLYLLAGPSRGLRGSSRSSLWAAADLQPASARSVVAAVIPTRRPSFPSSRFATLPLLQFYAEVRYTRHAVPMGATAWGTRSGRGRAPPLLVSHDGTRRACVEGEPAWKQPVTLRNWSGALS